MFISRLWPNCPNKRHEQRDVSPSVTMCKAGERVEGTGGSGGRRDARRSGLILRAAARALSLTHTHTLSLSLSPSLPPSLSLSWHASEEKETARAFFGKWIAHNGASERERARAKGRDGGRKGGREEGGRGELPASCRATWPNSPRRARSRKTRLVWHGTEQTLNPRP